MNSKTFSFVVLFKWFELIYNISGAFLAIIGTVQLKMELEGQAGWLLALSSACTMLMCMQVAYS